MSPVGIPPNATAAASAARSGLKQRVLTAMVLVPLLLACMFLLPNIIWALLMCVAAALAALEWSRLAGYRRSGSLFFTAVVTATSLGFIVLGASAPPLSAGAARRCSGFTCWRCCSGQALPALVYYGGA